MMSYYDAVLGLIPLSLAGLTVAFLFVGFSMSTAVPIASVATVGLMGHAMFVRAPVSSDGEPHATTRQAGERAYGSSD